MLKKSTLHLVRMNNPKECNDSKKCCYALDGKSHGKIPSIVLIGLEDIFGGLPAIIKAGYVKYWMFFEHPVTHEYTFGNKYDFENGSPEERQLAKHFEPVSANILCKL